MARASNDNQENYIGNQTGGRVTFFLNTDDFRRDYKTYQTLGIEFVCEPKEADYGMVAVFKDLYGNFGDLDWTAEKTNPKAGQFYRANCAELVHEKEYYRFADDALKMVAEKVLI